MEKKYSWVGFLSVFLLTVGILQLIGGILMLFRFHAVKPQSFILGISFLVIAIALFILPKAGGRDANVKSDPSLPLKCPKCCKTYDNSWKVCLSCSEKLVENNQNKE